MPWQIVPAALPRLLADPDPAVAARVFAAMQTMVKLDAAAIERAAGAPRVNRATSVNPRSRRENRDRAWKKPRARLYEAQRERR